MTNKIITLEIPEYIMDELAEISENTHSSINEVLCAIIEDGVMLEKSKIRKRDGKE